MTLLMMYAVAFGIVILLLLALIELSLFVGLRMLNDDDLFDLAADENTRYYVFIRAHAEWQRRMRENEQ